MHLQEALDQFLVQLQANGRSSHTVAQYDRHARLFARWFETNRPDADVGDVEATDVAEFMTSRLATDRPDGQPKKAASVNSLRTSLREFFRYLHESGSLDANPARLLRHARCSPAPPRALSGEARQRLLAVLDEAVSPEARRDRALFRLMLFAGLRIGSALGLDVEDIDLERGELIVRRAKNDAPSVAVVPASMEYDLREFTAERTTGPIFVTSVGKRLGARQAQRRFAALVGRAGLPQRIRPHDLRHSFATTLLERSGDLALVQRALGHRSIVSTTVYAEASRCRLHRMLSAS